EFALTYLWIKSWLEEPTVSLNMGLQRQKWL
ncbi:unnamed protein product, partial [marine sediment metagenome]